MTKKTVEIIGVPLDMGAKKLGVAMGPDSIRVAGLHEALSFNQINFVDHGNMQIRHDPPEDSRAVISRISEELAETVSTSLRGGSLPVILGGDHSSSIGSIAGASKMAKSLGVIWVDFHPDANTPETSPSGNIHGMPVAISLGYGYPELVNCGGFHPKVLPSNLVLVGAKDIDRGERDLLERLGVKMFTLYDIDRIGIFKVVDEIINKVRKCDVVHLSLDVDALDPIIAPGTGILSKGGLSYREISYIMETLGREDIVDSVDIIEVNPLLDVKNCTAELAVELLISALGGSFGDYERNYLLAQKMLDPER